jgi:hypothetical protein
LLPPAHSQLAATLADAPVVLFLDAALDQTPGLVLYRSVSPHHLGSASHHLSPEQLLDLARTLNGGVPPAFLITGGVQRIDIGDILTPAAERCAARMADVALEILGLAPPAIIAIEQRPERERQELDERNAPQETLAFIEKFASHMRPGCRSEDHADLYGEDGLPR